MLGNALVTLGAVFSGTGILAMPTVMIAQVTNDPVVTASGAGVIASAGALMIWVGRKMLSGELVAKNTEELLQVANATIAELKLQGEAQRRFQESVLDQLRTQNSEMKTIVEANTGALAVAHNVLLQLGLDATRVRQMQRHGVDDRQMQRHPADD